VKVRYRYSIGNIVTLDVREALRREMGYYVDPIGATLDLLVLLMGKGILTLDEVSSMVNATDILGWAEDDNGEG
jgi:hypothetical protein